MIKNPKPLSDLTEAEFDKLAKSGLLKTIYPDAPNTYKELKGIRPKPLAKPDFTSLIKLCEEYLDSKQAGKYMKDDTQWFFEEAINCVYGDNKKSGVWDFVNKNSH